MRNCVRVMLSLASLTTVAAVAGRAAKGHREVVAKGNKIKFVGNVMVSMATAIERHSTAGEQGGQQGQATRSTGGARGAKLREKARPGERARERSGAA